MLRVWLLTLLNFNNFWVYISCKGLLSNTTLTKNKKIQIIQVIRKSFINTGKTIVTQHLSLYQYKLWSFCTSPLCENTVFLAIILNTISLAMKFYHQPEWYTDFLDVLNLIFTFFFVGEFILKFGAFR